MTTQTGALLQESGYPDDILVEDASRLVITQDLPSIRTALARLVAIEEALTITDPTSQTIRKAWKTAPPAATALADHSFINIPTLIGVSWHVGLEVESWEINAQFFQGEGTSETDFRIDSTLEFYIQFLTALRTHVTLSGAVTQMRPPRGSSPTVGTLGWAGKDYIGFSLILPVEMKRGVTIS